MESISFKTNTNTNNNSTVKAIGKGAAIGGGLLLTSAAIDTVQLSSTAKKFSNWTKENPNAYGKLNFKESFKKVWDYFKENSNVKFDKNCGLKSITTLSGTPLKKIAPIGAAITMAGSIVGSVIVNAIKNAKTEKTE